MAKRSASTKQPQELQWYDERSYPRSADSDMESEIGSEISVDSEDHTSVNMEEIVRDSNVQTDLIEDFICVICAQLLVDPTTLHCGHSFCQLCLANVLETRPGQLQCPVCRQPWRNIPGINIQLRNIIDRSYPKHVETRRSAMTDSELKLLKNFNRARETEGQTRRNGRNLPPDMRRVVQTLLVLFAIAIASLIVVFCLVLWVWAGASGEFMRKPVVKWNSEDVAGWVEGLGDWAKHNYSEIFRKEHITGPRLLLLDEQALKTIGIKMEYRVRTILQGIEELKLADFSVPRNLQEFKAAHRKQTLLIAAFYKSWPRLTFLYVYFFHYYETFLPLIQFHFPLEPADVEGMWKKEQVVQYETENAAENGEVFVETTEEEAKPTWRQLLAFTVEVLLIPHFLVAWYAWSWFGIHPWICSAVIVHCMWITWYEGYGVVSAVRGRNWMDAEWMANWRAKIPNLLKTASRKILRHYFSFAFFFFIATVIWHITPHFLCDILFYLILWHTLYMHIVLNTILKVWRIRRERRMLLEAQQGLM